MSSLRKRKASSQDDEPIRVQRCHKHIKTTHTLAIAVSTPASTQRQKHTTETAIKHLKTTRAPPIEVSKPANMQKQPVTLRTGDTGMKRKRGTADDSQQAGSKRKIIPAPTRDITTPLNQRFRNALPPSPAETPSKRAANLFGQLDIQGGQLDKQKPIAYDTPPATPESLRLDFEDILLPQLADLVAIYAALITAINEQAALSRSDFRIAIKALLQVTTNVWNKREVNVDDIRRVLAVDKDSGLGWALEDYGRAGLCLVYAHGQDASLVSILDTLKLRRSFQHELQRQWTHWKKRNTPEINTFVQQLPLVVVPVSETVHNTASLLLRGRDRLSSIKASQAAAQVAEIEKKNKVPVQATTQARGTSLLDRIHAKQTANAMMPAGPTKEQLERRSCVQRIEEITRVLDIMSAGRGRASFSMPSVVQQLQQSLKTPISRIDVEHCISIMAKDIMPQFMSIICSGSVSGIVITRAGKLGLADLKKRLADVDV